MRRKGGWTGFLIAPMLIFSPFSIYEITHTRKLSNSTFSENQHLGVAVLLNISWQCCLFFPPHTLIISYLKITLSSLPSLPIQILSSPQNPILTMPTMITEWNWSSLCNPAVFGHEWKSKALTQHMRPFASHSSSSLASITPHHFSHLPWTLCSGHTELVTSSKTPWSLRKQILKNLNLKNLFSEKISPQSPTPLASFSSLVWCHCMNHVTTRTTMARIYWSEYDVLPTFSSRLRSSNMGIIFSSMGSTNTWYSLLGAHWSLK